MKNVIVKTSEEYPDTLLNHPANFREHGDEQTSAMEAILSDVGFVSEILVNLRTMRILDGHMRAEIARTNGVMIPVRWVDIPEEDEAKYLAVIDPTARLAKIQRNQFDKICKASFGEGTALKVLQSTLPKLKTLKPKVAKPEPPEDAEPVKELNGSFLSVLDDIPTSDDDPLPVMEQSVTDEQAKFIPVMIGDTSFLVACTEFQVWEQALRAECGDNETVIGQTILTRLGLSDDVPQ